MRVILVLREFLGRRPGREHARVRTWGGVDGDWGESLEEGFLRDEVDFVVEDSDIAVTANLLLVVTLFVVHAVQFLPGRYDAE